MGQYEKPDGTRRRTPAVPGATADNRDDPCFGQRLPVLSAFPLGYYVQLAQGPQLARARDWTWSLPVAGLLKMRCRLRN